MKRAPDSPVFCLLTSILENKFYAELNLTAFLRGWLVKRSEIGQFADEFAGRRICLDRDVVVSDDAIDIKKILEFAEDFEFVSLGKIKETRVVQINVKLRWSFSRIAFDADGSIQTRYAVVIDIRSRNDVECFAAVGGGDNAELVVVEKVAKRFVPKVELRAGNQTHHKSMALGGERIASVQTAIIRV